MTDLFTKYKSSDDENIIDVDGTINYLEDLELSPEDIKALSLAYLLKAPKMGTFTKERFTGIWQYYKVFDLNGMKKFINKFHNDLVNNNNNMEYIDLDTSENLSLQGMYNFTFGFLMEVENQRLLDTETAIDYWKLILPIVTESYLHEITPIDEDEFVANVNTRSQQWFDFLVEENKKAITFDTWSMFYLFFKEVVLDDPTNFKNYDEMAAWPSFMDEYIEFLYDKELLTPP